MLVRGGGHRSNLSRAPRLVSHDPGTPSLTITPPTVQGMAYTAELVHGRSAVCTIGPPRCLLGGSLLWVAAHALRARSSASPDAPWGRLNALLSLPGSRPRGLGRV